MEEQKFIFYKETSRFCSETGKLSETLWIAMTFCVNHCSDLANRRSLNTITATLSAQQILKTLKKNLEKSVTYTFFTFYVSVVHNFYDNYCQDKKKCSQLLQWQ
jgi:hypothetical protein